MAIIRSKIARQLLAEGGAPRKGYFDAGRVDDPNSVASGLSAAADDLNTGSSTFGGFSGGGDGDNITFTSPKAMSVSDFSQVAKRFKNPLMVLDKVGNGKFKKPKKKGGYTLGTTPLITALLMAFKKHDVKLDANGECSHKLFEIANQLNDGYCQQGERMDGVSHIITEWKEDLLIPEKPFNFNTIDQELSFVLYWIEVALSGKKLKEIGNPGNKSWTTYVNRYVSNTFDCLDSALKTNMVE